MTNVNIFRLLTNNSCILSERINNIINCFLFLFVVFFIALCFETFLLLIELEFLKLIGRRGFKPRRPINHSRAFPNIENLSGSHF